MFNNYLLILICILILIIICFYYKNQQQILIDSLKSEKELHKQLQFELALNYETLKVKYEELNVINKELDIKNQLQKEQILEYKKILTYSEESFQQQKIHFESISNFTLNNQTDSFLKKMDFFLQQFQNKHVDNKKDFNEVLNPIIKVIEQFQEETKQMELKHMTSNEVIKSSLKDLNEAYKGLTEATNLLTSSHKTSGQWGEIQLVRLLEYTGLLKYCEFQEQVCLNTDEGVLKPDVLINLPGSIYITIDAKTPLISYNKYITNTNLEEKKKYKKEYYKAIKAHVTSLGNKKYWRHFNQSPEMVIMFLPGEHFWQLAMDENEEILEYAYNNHVIISTPLTLIPLLKIIGALWSKYQISNESEKLKEHALFLYENIKKITDLVKDMGKSFENSYKIYNKILALEINNKVFLEKFKEDYFPALPNTKIK